MGNLRVISPQAVQGLCKRYMLAKQSCKETYTTAVTYPFFGCCALLHAHIATIEHFLLHIICVGMVVLLFGTACLKITEW